MKTEILSGIAIGRNNLSEIVKDIVKNADPEKILLISAVYDYRLTENIFRRKPLNELKSSHYSLLFLGIQEKSAFSIKNMQSSKRLMAYPSNLQLFFMDIHDFNNKLDAGDEYASEIVLNAMIWYDKGDIALHTPKLKLD